MSDSSERVPVIAVASGKGGVGKTAAAWAGRRGQVEQLGSLLVAEGDQGAAAAC
jgi:MinD-like ATPase involved in chromosome partitioning or flagellar assembly